jgi:hypothetical protein
MVDEALLRTLTPTVIGIPRPPRSRLRGGRGVEVPYLHERAGDPATAARLHAEAARSAPNLPERDHLTRQAARRNAEPRS